MRNRVALTVVLCSLVFGAVACGGGGPTSPSGSSPGTGSNGGTTGTGGTGGSGGGGGGTAPNHGTLTAVIDGVPYSGVVRTATSQSGIFAAAAMNDANVGFGIGALAVPGTTAISATSPTNALLTAGTGVPAMSWFASTSGGSGTLTISTITATGATGTFQFTMPPTPGTGASGTRSVTNGTFSVTF